MNEQFYPFWYKNKIVLENKRQFRKISILLTVYMVLGIINIYSITRDIQQYERAKNIEVEEVIHEKKEFKVVDKLNNIIQVLHCDDNTMKALQLSGEEIYMEIFIEDKNEYEEIIRVLENNFIIVDISPIIKESETTYFYIRMINNDF